MSFSRSQLQRFLPDQESIRIFEDVANAASSAYLSAGVIQTLPAQVSGTTLSDSGLIVPVASGATYKFEFFAAYTASAGTRFTVDGPAGVVRYRSEWSLTDSTNTEVNAVAYHEPASANASTLTGGTVRIEGIAIPSADGTIKMQFASSATVTIIGGYAKLIRLT